MRRTGLDVLTAPNESDMVRRAVAYLTHGDGTELGIQRAIEALAARTGEDFDELFARVWAAAVEWTRDNIRALRAM